MLPHLVEVLAAGLLAIGGICVLISSFDDDDNDGGGTTYPAIFSS